MELLQRFITAAGVAGLGVLTRARFVRGLPVVLNVTALMPVPPMSMARVRSGWDLRVTDASPASSAVVSIRAFSRNARHFR